MNEFYMIIAKKLFSRFFWRGGGHPSLPPCPMPMTTDAEHLARRLNISDDIICHDDDEDEWADAVNIRKEMSVTLTAYLAGLWRATQGQLDPAGCRSRSITVPCWPADTRPLQPARLMANV